MGKIKKFFDRFWYLLWKDNSIKGWILSIVVIFVVIKFVFFPLLNLITGTPLPIAIVESCSMYHQGDIFSNFNSWWQRHDAKYSSIGISEQNFSHFSLSNGFSKGDVIFIVGADPNKLKIGDVIVFSSGTENTPVIHRIINITEVNGTRVFTTMGDNNNAILMSNNNQGQVDERAIYPNQIVGKAVFRIAPYIGWIKLVFFDSRLPSYERGFCSES
ncbi:MAG: signal peptidase I [Candidatus Pacearchaeota archaeon]|nr:signal peptidase I [Candidatus Pacearchaeota archaeon]